MAGALEAIPTGIGQPPDTLDSSAGLKRVKHGPDKFWLGTQTVGESPINLAAIFFWYACCHSKRAKTRHQRRNQLPLS